MKAVLYVFLSLAVLTLFFCAACSSSSQIERQAIVAYLTDFNRIDNDLNQSLSSALGSASLLSSAEKATETIIQVASAEQEAMQRLSSLSVPDIAQARANMTPTSRYCKHRVTSYRRSRPQ
jgi:hypothetical protein